MISPLAVVAAAGIFAAALTPSPAAFALSFSIPKPIPGENQRIPIIGSTVRIKGLTHQTNKAFVNGREMPIQPDGTFQEEVIIPLGHTEISISVVDKENKVKEYRKKITARKNHYFLVGLADGTLNFSEAGENIKWERDGKKIKEGFRVDGKISYYFAGKILGRYLIKSAVDTGKSTQEKLFTSIDPDKYYPVYGDNSTVVYDVNSQGKFYILLEWDRSGVTFGNYQTQIGDEDSKLLTYNRTLYGGKAYLETHQRTVYGDPVGKATLFWAEANQQAGHSELLATGGSLYYLRHRKIVEGSEQVRIEVRDKVSGMTLHSASQAQGMDYEIKYDEGRILFKKPVLSIAPSDTLITTSILEGNPVYVVVNYEYKNQEAFPITREDLDHKTAGFRLSHHLGNHVRGGVTHLQEEKDGRYYKLLGGDVTAKIGNFTKINAEFAHASADSTQSYISYNGGYDYTEVSMDNLTDGSAFRVEAHTSLGEYFGKKRGFLDLSGFWQRIDHQFSPVDSLFEAGTQKFGVDISHRLTADDNLRFLYEEGRLEKNSSNPSAKNQLQAQKLQNLVTQWTHLWNKFTLTTEYSYKDDEASLSPIQNPGKGRVKGHLLGERVQYEFSPGNSVFAGQQIGLGDLNDSFTSMGFSKRLRENLSIHGQAGAGPMGNSVRAGLERNIDRKNSIFAHYALAHSPADGRTSITSFGSNTAISENAQLRRERQFVTSDTRGVYRTHLLGYEHQITPEFTFDASYQRRDEKQDPLTLTDSEARDAATAHFSYIRPDKFKIFSRTEYRLNTDNLWQILADNQGELKLTQDIFLFGEHEFSRAKKAESGIDKRQVGLAFRPVPYDWFNALFKYIFFIDHRPQNLTSADGGSLITQSQSDTLAAEYAVDFICLPWLLRHLQFVQKFAFKDEEVLASDVSNIIKTPEDLQAFLWINRLNYHLSDRIDLAVEYRRLRQKGSDIHTQDQGILLEVTYQIIQRIAIGAGFNFTDFTDDLTVRDRKSTRGFFLRLQGKY